GAARAPLKELGEHPRTAAPMKLMEGRYGPYVTDGTTNATLPKSIDPQALTAAEAAQLLDDRAAAAPPAKGKRKVAAKKPAAKADAAPAKKAAGAKAAPAKKIAVKKPGVAKAKAKAKA
ncbi:topoisomerase C-terminal repeat-containing protein, partial [Sphingomonas bacterium]|uniref:topoisomerase C-terminal repeat-containing protein n=1 Tax=Sphingomonas bacterium TaxID=1895847 RepID=UPI00266E93A0